jgi:hypothetical protein
MPNGERGLANNTISAKHGIGGEAIIVRRLVLIASAVILVAIIGSFLSNDGQAKAGSGAMVHLPAQSPSTVRAAETLTPTSQVYLPFVYRNFPPVIQVPEGEYLLVEYWTHSVLGTNCEGLCIDFPAYYFDPQSGVLTIYPPDPTLVLAGDEIGYVGSGESLGGVGCGASSGLTKIRQCPLTVYGAGADVTLRYADETGAITLERKGEVITLGPGEAWVSAEETEVWDWNGEGCVVTHTHYITNYAFQDRDKIIYPP